MKILAVVTAAPGAPMTRVRAELADELKASWQLYAAGVLREAYATASPAQVVFVLEAQDGAQAAQILGRLLHGGSYRVAPVCQLVAALCALTLGNAYLSAGSG